MKQLVRHQYRAALWLLVLVTLVTSSLALTGGASAGSSASYTLTGYVEQGSGVSPVPAGVQVDLVSRATGQVFTTSVASGGMFTFTTSSTGGALVPGYWGVWVPPQGNVSLPGCNPVAPYYQCAVLPTNQNPAFAFENATALTTPNYPTVITGVSVYPYAGNLSGTVSSGGTNEPGAQVSLIDPIYSGFVFVSNTTSNSGAYRLSAPLGTWVLKTTLPGASVRYNLTQVTIPSRAPVVVNPDVQNYIVSGYSNLRSTGAHVPTAGNVTLWDPTNGYLYASATPPGGFYSAGTYPAGFTSGSQTFDVILSSIGYGTVWYPLSVSSPTPVQQNVLVAPLAANQYGRYQTVLNFAGLNVSTGKGNLVVNTTATLGNDTVVPNLPNATVGQLWGQLGLDFDHSTTFASSSLPAVASFVNSTGPFFPAVQAGTAVNGTGFVGPSGPQTLASWASTCSGSCNLSTSANLTYVWSQTYALNGTVPVNQSTYSIALSFAHPASSSDVYNYTFVLPSGFVLAASTQVPTATVLTPAGVGGTWTSFTLRSLPSATAQGSAKFSIVKFAGVTPIVNVTVSNFAFSKRNVLNSTEDNYTVEVGTGQNVTFSALNSLYPAGTNGTRFVWTFGDGGSNTTSSATTNHTYAAASGSTPYAGTLTVTSSGGLKNSTKFFVWVAAGPVKAVISVNSTAYQNRTVNGVPYVFVNWSTVLQFNASRSTSTVSPTATVPGVVSVASYVLVSSKGFKQTANFTASSGGYFWQNWTVQFLGAGSYLSAGTVGGNSVPFYGWQYNLTMTVWDGTGHVAKAALVILVNDTEKPNAAFQLLNSGGTPIKGNGIVAGTNLSAKVLLNGANSSDPHNGSIAHYYWLITNSKNSSVHIGMNFTTVKVSGVYPSVWLSAAVNPYTVNLTVRDLNGNTGYTTQSLAVSKNSSTSPIMAVDNSPGNFSIPSSFTDGTSYTLWINITVGGGTKSVAHNVQVAFYLLSPGGGGSRVYIGGSPASVKFYNYSSGVVSATPFSVGNISSLAWNQTVRAEITWTPALTGSFTLYVNATASNEYTGDYLNGPNQKSFAISIKPNPTTQLLEYVAIGVAVVVVIALLVIYYRRRSGKGAAKPSSSRSGLERSKKSADDDDEDDE